MRAGIIFVRDIMREVERRHRLPVGALRSWNNERDVAWPRQEAMLLARLMTRKEWTVIGRLFDRHHTTVLYAYKAARRRCLADRQHLKTLCEIRAAVRAQAIREVEAA